MAVYPQEPTIEITQLVDAGGSNLASIFTDGSIAVLPSLVGFVKANKVYSTFIDVSAATANTDNALVLLRNPSGSGKVIYIGLISANTTVTNVSAEFKVFANPVVLTNGSTQIPTARNIGNGASPAVGLLTTLPTVTSNGSVICGSITGQNSSDVDLVDDFSIGIQPNNSILVTANPSSNNRNMGIEIKWAEI